MALDQIERVPPDARSSSSSGITTTTTQQRRYATRNPSDTPINPPPPTLLHVVVIGISLQPQNLVVGGGGPDALHQLTLLRRGLHCRNGSGGRVGEWL